MRQTENLGLALYDTTDKMNITGAENSLNHNMGLIDAEIAKTMKTPESGETGQVLTKTETGFEWQNAPTGGGSESGSSEVTSDDILKLKNDISEVDNKVDVVTSRVDNLTATDPGSTGDNAELLDIRVGNDGTTYPTAGDAVRTQVGNLKGDLDEVSPLIFSKNLFNKDYEQSSNPSDGKITLGSVNQLVKINVVGSFSQDSSLFLSQYIKVKPNTKYYINGGVFIREFDIDKNIVVNSNRSNSIVTSDTTEYIRFNALESNISNVMLCEGDPQIYAPYFEPYRNPIVTKTSELINDSNFIDASVDTTNLLSTENALIDKQFVASGGIQNMTGWVISDYIPVEAGKSYRLDFGIYGLDYITWGYYQTYKADKLTKVVTRGRYDTQDNPFVFEFAEDSEVAFIRLNPSANALSNMIFHEGTEPINHVRKSLLVENLGLTKKNFPSTFSNWFGKKLCAYGDSNTGNKKWQKYVCEELGLVYSHCGIGGTTAVGRCSDDSLLAIPLDSDVITIMFGTNDASQNIPVGELPSEKISTETVFDTTTYVGALCRIIQYVSTNIPKCEIVLIAPPFRSQNTYGSEVQTEFGNNYKFNLYIDACEQISKRLGCHFINSYQEMGANIYNYKEFFLNEGDNAYAVHFNDLGGKRFAKCVIETLKRIEPIE